MDYVKVKGLDITKEYEDADNKLELLSQTACKAQNVTRLTFVLNI